MGSAKGSLLCVAIMFLEIAMIPATHYQHSGKAPLASVLMTLIGGLVAGVVLGGIYGFLLFWSPFVYINALITFGFGYGLALAVGSLAKLGKIRNSGVLTAIALIVALVAYHVHWNVWVGRMVQGETVDDLWAFISMLNAVGPWEIFGWTPTGFALWAIWGLEALVIVGIGTFSAHGVIDVPFCEETRQWTTEKALSGQFAPVAETTRIDSPVALLQSLRPADGADGAYAEVSIATAKGSELRCVSLENVVVSVNDEGKEETEKSNIVKYMLFDRDSFENLMKLAQPAAG